MLSPRWSSQPLSGEGSASRCGRWNAAGQPALYLSEDHGTAIAEYLQSLTRPGLLTPYAVDALLVLDLTDVATKAALGFDPAMFQLDWRRVRDIERARPLTWDFAEAAQAAGFVGLRVPSAQAQGVNIVLWRWNTPGGAAVEAVDPNSDLPRDASSWTGER
jgi:RES domain-containing protein